DQVPSSLDILDQGGFFRSLLFPGMSLSTLVPPTPIDLITLYPDLTTWVVREGMRVSTDTQIAISASEAIHPITFSPVDENGAPVSLSRNLTYTQLVAKSHAYGHFATWGPGPTLTTPTTFHFSTMSGAYTFEASVLQEPADGGTLYVFNGAATNGISGPVSFANAPDDFRHVTWRYTPAAGGTSVTPQTFFTSRPWNTLFSFGVGRG